MDFAGVKPEAQQSLIFISKRLEVAINYGNVDEAGKLAKILAYAQAPIIVNDLTDLEKEIKIFVTIEHKDNISLTLIALPSSSVLSLKTQLFHLYKFLPEEQRLIISNRLALNEEVLQTFLKESETTLSAYVYIMSKDNSFDQREL